ncbi:poly(A) polymerase type 3-like [Stegodyphus dumicola]|uniref:poly(A) polymerase type 3-like n=1 Tax=Stegodyphus dumicola TaxID=202533 RepID=UPI0015AA7B30|nr:poly(A) polymerase type 3-like [Stegodyphus dumicola]
MALTKVLGVSSPINIDMPTAKDIQKTKELEEVLKEYDLFESHEEFACRLEVLSKLNNLVRQWIQATCLQKNIPRDVAETANGKLYAFGSYRLGVHTKGADMDTLCVAPSQIDRADFFTSFVDLLKEQCEVKGLRTIEDAFVPVIKLNFNGIELDMVFARLAVESVAEDQDLSNVNILKHLDLKCVRSLNGYRVTDEIYRLRPNPESFKLTLVCIKFWAKKNGLYSNVLGYLGGVSWAILVARICQLYPNATAATLVYKFFFVYSMWKWPCPVLLKQPDINKLGFNVWDPRINVGDRYHLMPIITPAYPHQNSAFNVTFSTRTILENSFKHGSSVAKNIISGNCKWDELFKSRDFFSDYKQFIMVTASACTKEDYLIWSGLVESKIRILISQVERQPYVNFVHVSPETFTNFKAEPSSYSSAWFMGLQFSQTEKIKLNLTPEVQVFTNTIMVKALKNKLFKRGMKVEVKHICNWMILLILPSWFNNSEQLV